MPRGFYSWGDDITIGGQFAGAANQREAKHSSSRVGLRVAIAAIGDHPHDTEDTIGSRLQNRMVRASAGEGGEISGEQRKNLARAKDTLDQIVATIMAALLHEGTRRACESRLA